MELFKEHISPQEAFKLQLELRNRVELAPFSGVIHAVAGADVSFNKYSPVVHAAIVVLSYPGLSEIEVATATVRSTFPYIPGFLSFREIPALLAAWNKLKNIPDIMIVDGHGIAHPRRLGIASHFGIITNTAAIGCAKSVLTGVYSPPGIMPDSTSELLDVKGGEVLGIALRTKMRANPIIISPGHKITLSQSVDVVKTCLKGYRLPEPTRRAHMYANRVRKETL